MPSKAEAKELVKIATDEQLRQMLFKAQVSVTDWTVASRINPSISKGGAFNILKAAIGSKSELARRNLLVEFGEFFPGYEKTVRSKRQIVPMSMHQEPEFLVDDGVMP